VAERIDNARGRMRDDPSDTPRNLLEAMITLSDAPDSGFTQEALSANVLTLLLAGEDTTAHMLAWTMPFLCADPALQDRLHAEAVDRFGEARVCPVFEQVRTLDRFEAAATEASRFKPTIPILMFEATEPTVLDGVALPVGSRATVLQRHVMQDPRNFEDPQRYDPERWIRARDERPGAHEPRAYLQFGAGARVCPGRHLAGVELRLVLSMLARNFTARLDGAPNEIEEVLAFTMMPSTMPVRLSLREAT
jgi:cytochrome P450